MTSINLKKINIVTKTTDKNYENIIVSDTSYIPEKVVINNCCGGCLSKTKVKIIKKELEKPLSHKYEMFIIDSKKPLYLSMPDVNEDITVYIKILVVKGEHYLHTNYIFENKDKKHYICPGKIYNFVKYKKKWYLS